MIAELEAQLRRAAVPAFAQSMQRYFTQPVAALGVSNAMVGKIAAQALVRHPGTAAADWLAVAAHFAHTHAYHEHVMLASALMVKVVKSPDPDGELLAHMQNWLEDDVSNWAQCDDLCIKPLYLYLKRHPHRRERVFAWGMRSSPWCRRASNVGLVKLVGRVQGFELAAMFANCARLLADPDPYVQKGIGWMLKVASQYEEAAVRAFLREHARAMPPATMRYAMEKLR